MGHGGEDGLYVQGEKDKTGLKQMKEQRMENGSRKAWAVRGAAQGTAQSKKLRVAQRVKSRAFSDDPWIIYGWPIDILVIIQGYPTNLPRISQESPTYHLGITYESPTNHLRITYESPREVYRRGAWGRLKIRWLGDGWMGGRMRFEILRRWGLLFNGL